jgi:2-polyprenyl-3-methyl-5-hydroxy-6-metoxy-1,4-benzoquinol methylase
MYSVIVHVANEDAIAAEIENLPSPNDTVIFLSNPRRRDGKDLHYMQAEVQTIVIPWWRINFLEIMPSGEEEEIVAFYKD